jgi:hypothetical protein
LVRNCKDLLFLTLFLLQLRVVFHVADDVRHLLLVDYLGVVVGARVLLVDYLGVVVGARVMLLFNGLRFLLLLLFLYHRDVLLRRRRQLELHPLPSLRDWLALRFEQMQS